MSGSVTKQHDGRSRADRQDEQDRLAELSRSGLLGSPPEGEFDRITRLARKVLGVDAAFVNLIDAEHQYTKSSDGTEPGSERLHPLSVSFCKYVVASGETFVVRDAHHDPLVRNSPGIEAFDMQAYAGSPLQTTSGHVLGTVCVINHRPHDWTDDQLVLLDDLAALAVTEIEYRLRSQKVETIRVLSEKMVDPLEGLADAVRSTSTLVDPPGDPRLPRTVDIAVERLRTVEAFSAGLRAALHSSPLTGLSINLDDVLDRALALVGEHSDSDVLDVVRPEHGPHVQAKMALHRPLAALLQAAVQNLGQGARCRVEVVWEGDTITLVVSSPGAGLPNATLLRLVSKFTAADTGDHPTQTEAAAVHRQGQITVVEHGAVRAVNGSEGFEFSLRLQGVDTFLDSGAA